MSVNNIKNIDISILTARTGKESFRVMSTLAHWGVNVHGIYFCGSKEKGPIVAAIRLELMQRVKDGVITLTRAQAELKIIKDNATQNGKITRSQACR